MCVCVCVCVCRIRNREIYIKQYQIRLCAVVMFYVWRFEPHTGIVTEGFGAMKMHLLFIMRSRVYR